MVGFRGAAISGLSLALIATAAQAMPSASERVAALSDALVDLRLKQDPLSGLSSGLVDPAAIRLSDRSPAALAALAAGEDAIARQLKAIDTSGLATPADQAAHAILVEALESSRQLRVCHGEQWAISHMVGWQVALPMIAGAQPVATPEQRARALDVWRGLPAFVDTEIANLRRGQAAGYAVPKPVVDRVIGQLDAAIGAPVERSPLFTPARKAADPAYAVQVTALIRDTVNPALKRYRDYLRDDYRPRDTLALADLPDGAACYQALLRSYTTLNRSPAETARAGAAAVARNAADVAALGRERFKTADFAGAVAYVAKAPDNRFSDEAQMLAFSRDALARADARLGPFFVSLPAQAVQVQPLPDFQRGSGIPAHYQPSPDPRVPATYRSPTEQWAKTTRGDAEVTAAHEANPGHHLQIVTARGSAPTGRLARLYANPAYFEGWARYAEGLAEEAGIYQTPYALVGRRAWPGRGMVLDPGLHVQGWSRERAVAYAVESGRFNREEAEALVDRSAAMPGQLAAYDTGALEIAALRGQAEKALGSRFSLPEFHARILESGAIPLGLLRRRIEAWIAKEKS